MATAIADGTVIYVGLNADGTVYTAADGSTPNSTTNGIGHWYSTEYNPMVWGTEGLTMFAYLEGDGATFTLGFANSGSFVEGDSHKIAAKYIYGETAVAFEVVINVIAKPEGPAFQAPEADETFEVEVIEGKSGSYEFMTDEMETLILATLGVDGDYDLLDDAITEGAVTIMGYMPDGTMSALALPNGTDGWMNAEGAMTSWGTTGFAVCVKPWMDPIGIYINMAAGDEAVGYFAYVATETEAQFVVEAKVKCIEAPKDLTEYVLQDTYEVAFETSFAAAYGGGTHTIDPGTAADMATSIDLADLSESAWVMLNADQTVAGSDNMGGTNGWYGIDGPAAWANAASLVFLNNDGGGAPSSWTYGCHPDHATVGDVVTVRLEFRNKEAQKSVRYYATITVVD